MPPDGRGVRKGMERLSGSLWERAERMPPDGRGVRKGMERQLQIAFGGDGGGHSFSPHNDQ